MTPVQEQYSGAARPRTRSGEASRSRERTIVVLHENGAPEHYLALAELAKVAGYTLKFQETNFLRSLAAGVLRKDWKRFRKSLTNFVFCTRLALGIERPSALIVGFAPYDWRPIPFLAGLGRNRVLLHTSWPNWEGPETPKSNSPINRSIWTQKFLSHLSGIFFVTSQAQASFFRKHKLGVPSSVVYHAFDPDVFFATDQSSDGRPFRVGFAGRLVACKGIDLFLQVAENLKDEDVEFCLAGTGNLMGYVEAETTSRSLRLKALGKLSRSELAEMLREVDVMLLPSKRTPGWEEAFGMIVIEAMACGAVPLTTDHSGPLEILNDFNSDLTLSEPGFIYGATAAIQRYLREPDALRRDRAACIAYAGSYSKRNLAERWADLLADILDLPESVRTGTRPHVPAQRHRGAFLGGSAAPDEDQPS